MQFYQKDTSIFLDNNKDEKASSFSWVKKSVVTELDESVCAFKNAIRIQNKHTDIQIAFDKIEAKQGWIEEIKNLM